MHRYRHDPQHTRGLDLGSLAEADFVEQWKAAVRCNISGASGRSPYPLTSLHLTLGFFAVAILAGARHGPSASVHTLLALSFVLLTNELPRGLLGRAHGRSTRIVLCAFGSRTELSGRAFSGMLGVAWLLVGPLANLLAALGLAWVAGHSGQVAVASAFNRLAVCQAAWGVIQLVPVFPFHAGSTLARRMSPALRFAYASASATLLIAFAMLFAGRASAVMLGIIGLMACACVREVLQTHAELLDGRNGMHLVVQTVQTELLEGRPELAVQHARQALSIARSPSSRQKLWTLLAWAGIGMRDPFLAHSALSRLPKAELTPDVLASYLSCCNRSDEALELLRHARAEDYRTRETTKLLIDLLFGREDYAAVRNVLSTDSALLTPTDHDEIAKALGGSPSSTVNASGTRESAEWRGGAETTRAR